MVAARPGTHRLRGRFSRRRYLPRLVAHRRDLRTIRAGRGAYRIRHRPRRCRPGRSKLRAAVGHRHRRQAGHSRPSIRTHHRRLPHNRRRSRVLWTLGSGPWTLGFSVDINNQPLRIGQQKRRVLRHLRHVQHHAGHVAVGLRRAYPREESAVGHAEALALQLRRQLHMVQVKEDAVRTHHPRRLILHLAALVPGQVDRQPGIRRRRPVPDPGHHRDRLGWPIRGPLRAVFARWGGIHDSFIGLGWVGQRHNRPRRNYSFLDPVP